MTDAVAMEVQPAALSRIKAALEFYADPKTYDDFGIPKIPHVGHTGCMVPDSGHTARVITGTSDSLGTTPQ